jgi:nucleoside-diphosphate-sugar epimerase
MAENSNHDIDSNGPAVLVTGGSGFVGSHLVKHLSEKSRTVVSLYHHRIPESHTSLYPVCSDMGSPELLAAPLRGVDTVFHLAWEGGIVGPQNHTQWDPGSLATLPKNVQITRNLVAAMEKTGTKRLIFLSGVGASRHTQEPFLMEKYLAEFFILNSTIPEKIILRSSVLWGGEQKEDRFLQSIQRVMRLPIYPVPRKGDGLSPLHIDDLCRVLYRLSTAKVSPGCHVLEVNGGDACQVEEVFKVVSERCATGGKIGLGGVLGESLLPLFERESSNGPKTPKLKHFLALGTNLNVDTGRANPLEDVIPKKMKRFTDLLPQTTPAETAVQSPPNQVQ